MLCRKCDEIRFSPPLANRDAVSYGKNEAKVTTKNEKLKPKNLSYAESNASVTGNNSTQKNSNQSRVGPENEDLSYQLDKQQTSCAPATTLKFVASTNDSTGSQLASLRAEVQRQQATKTKLQAQWKFLLSYFGVIEPDIEPINHDDNNYSGIPTNVVSHAKNQKLWSTVTANKKTQKSRNSFKQSLIAAVYTDQTESR